MSDAVATRSPHGEGRLAEQELEPDDPGALRGDVLVVIVGLVGTLGGAQLLVWAATGLADRAGLSGGLVGLTLVAVGTSLPEIATTLRQLVRTTAT